MGMNVLFKCMYECMYICMYVHSMHAWCTQVRKRAPFPGAQGQKEDPFPGAQGSETGPVPRFGVRDGCEPFCGCWEQEPGPPVSSECRCSSPTSSRLSVCDDECCSLVWTVQAKTL